MAHEFDNPATDTRNLMFINYLTTVIHNSLRFRFILLTTITCLIPIAGKTPEAADVILKKGDRVAIVGDSITEQKLYSKFIETYLLLSVPELNLKVMQFGWSGERAPGLVNRIENDLIPWKPDVITTCYGMNDGRYRKYEDSIGQTYRENMLKIVDRLKETGATVVVGSPGAVDTYTYERTARQRLTTAAVYNENLAQLRDIAKSIAKEKDMPFADIHMALMIAMKKAKASYGETYHVAGRDGVHPRRNGHLVMAYGFLRALGLGGQIGQIQIDWKGKTTATNGHKVLASSRGTIEIESTRYPFCFSGEEKNPDGTISILPFVPFQDNLNRLVLSVENLPSKQATVKWGTDQKTFTRDQLSKGINLSAEFLNNPFCTPFFDIMDRVDNKQRYETAMIKRLITNFRTLQQAFPEDEEVKNAMAILRPKLIYRPLQYLPKYLNTGHKPILSGANLRSK